MRLWRGSFTKARCTKVARSRLSISGLVIPIVKQRSIRGSNAALKARAISMCSCEAFMSD